VILAAGMGSRIASLGAPAKPLVRLGRHTLAYHVMQTLAEGAGIDRFIVVLGHASDLVGRHFAEVGGGLGVTVDFVIARDWRRGNGASCRSARSWVGDRNFVLTMTDHLFDVALVRTLAAADVPDDGLVLAVDFDKDGVFDLEDVTRVRVDRLDGGAGGAGAIAAIGKLIDPWDASDTGLFLCSPGLFGALDDAAAAGEHGLSDGVRRLAAEGRAQTCDVTGNWWMDVDTPTALAAAERHRQAVAKG
jgi:choline kinase